MLLMPTLELGDPVMLGVFMEAGDPPLHGSGDEGPQRPFSDAALWPECPPIRILWSAVRKRRTGLS
jgi:hypothetical protein